MPHHALVTGDGDALGPVELDGTEADWPNGRIIEGYEGRGWRVVGYLAAEEPESFDVLVVVPVV